MYKKQIFHSHLRSFFKRRIKSPLWGQNYCVCCFTGFSSDPCCFHPPLPYAFRCFETSSEAVDMVLW
ncbi:hypothetical protein XELAEV_18020558mg [Xenopus laevis]|uniref:Uncharacterized protein n=1 Tax=Xenopus laevis TaxID=8355 RepID=A0A974HR52_XENLA|nr:hypothetical protein XELAEV_18020558mg [Xenopus laevis]